MDSSTHHVVHLEEEGGETVRTDQPLLPTAIQSINVSSPDEAQGEDVEGDGGIVQGVGQGEEAHVNQPFPVKGGGGHLGLIIP